MLEIASQITICLLIAALIGFMIGYIMAKSVYTEPKSLKEPEPTKNTEENAKAEAKAAEEEIEKKAKEEEKAKAAAEKAKAEAAAKAAEEKAKTEAEAKAAAEKEKAQAGEKPELLHAPRNGEKDDLTLIKGIGPKVEEQLNAAGIFHMDQIANWTEANIKWLELHTSFAHRATKDQWADQAKSFK